MIRNTLVQHTEISNLETIIIPRIIKIILLSIGKSIIKIILLSIGKSPKVSPIWVMTRMME